MNTSKMRWPSVWADKVLKPGVVKKKKVYCWRTKLPELDMPNGIWKQLVMAGCNQTTWSSVENSRDWQFQD